MHKVDIAGHLQVDVAVLLVITEDFQVVHSDVADVGVRERGASATDAAPSRAAVVVDQNYTFASLGKVAECRTTSHTTSSNEDFGLGLFNY